MTAILRMMEAYEDEERGLGNIDQGRTIGGGNITINMGGKREKEEKKGYTKSYTINGSSIQQKKTKNERKEESTSSANMMITNDDSSKPTTRKNSKTTRNNNKTTAKMVTKTITNSLDKETQGTTYTLNKDSMQHIFNQINTQQNQQNQTTTPTPLKAKRSAIPQQPQKKQEQQPKKKYVTRRMRAQLQKQKEQEEKEDNVRMTRSRSKKKKVVVKKDDDSMNEQPIKNNTVFRPTVTNNVEKQDLVNYFSDNLADVSMIDAFGHHVNQHDGDDEDDMIDEQHHHHLLHGHRSPFQMHPSSQQLPNQQQTPTIADHQHEDHHQINLAYHNILQRAKLSPMYPEELASHPPFFEMEDHHHHQHQQGHDDDEFLSLMPTHHQTMAFVPIDISPPNLTGEVQQQPTSHSNVTVRLKQDTTTPRKKRRGRTPGSTNKHHPQSQSGQQPPKRRGPGRPPKSEKKQLANSTTPTKKRGPGRPPKKRKKGALESPAPKKKKRLNSEKLIIAIATPTPSSRTVNDAVATPTRSQRIRKKKVIIDM